MPRRVGIAIVVLVGVQASAQQRTLATTPNVSQPVAIQQRTSPGSTVALNPQPLPPRTALSLQQLRAMLQASGAKPRVGPRVKNPSFMMSPTITALRSQKQAGDLEANQVMSSGGVNAGTSGALLPARTVAMAPRTGTLAAGRIQAVPVPASDKYGKLPANSTICMQTGIATINKKANGIVFTPDPQYNTYTISGCGFGANPGNIYLVGNFPSHNGRIQLVPLQGTLWGKYWTDRFIQARVDPNVSGELDQTNVSLVVESTNGGRAQANGDSFYALRGDPILLQSLPQSMVNLNPKFGPQYLSPDLGSEAGGGGVTLTVYRTGMSDQDYKHPETCCAIPDDIKLNLKTGFAIESTQSHYYLGYNSFGYQLDDKGGLNGTEIQLRWYVTSASSNSAYPDAGPFYSLYSLKIWVVGPKGVTNPWAQ